MGQGHLAPTVLNRYGNTQPDTNLPASEQRNATPSAMSCGETLPRPARPLVITLCDAASRLAMPPDRAGRDHVHRDPAAPGLFVRQQQRLDARRFADVIGISRRGSSRMHRQRDHPAPTPSYIPGNTSGIRCTNGANSCWTSSNTPAGESRSTGSGCQPPPGPITQISTWPNRSQACRPASGSHHHEDVRLDGDRPAAPFLDVRDDGLRGLRARAIIDDHTCAFTRQRQCDTAAHAGAAAPVTIATLP